MTTEASADSLWRNRDYLLYRTSRTVSMLGSRMSTLAGPLLVLSIGGGPVWAGAVGTSWFVAQIVFQIPAGHLADRLPSRPLMLAMDLVRLLAIGSIPLASALGFLTLPQLLVVVFAEGGASVIFGSAAMVFMQALISKGQFSRAMSQSQFAYGATSVLGPMLGGVLYGVSHMLPFLADVASYVFSGALLLAMAARTRPAPDASSAPGEDKPADERATAGLRWLWSQRAILRIVLFGTVLNVVGSASGIAALVVMSQRGTPAGIIGTVIAFSGGAVMAGSLIAPRAVALGQRLFPIIGVLWAAAMSSVTLSPTPLVIGIVLTFLAVLGPAAGVALMQMLRDESPPGMFGRVVAAQQLVGTGFAAAAPLTAGALVAAFGGTYLWLVFGGLCLAGTLLVIGRLTTARQLPEEAPSPEQATMARGR